ncbi:helix-turn-helix transcriptional regulator [Polaribacter batillariae]|uniref:Helix-turn-helix transcriptional regulator n=1 Tax=Polaribacter batillariae TaxID=2808900 RepID=A0ABX7SXT7_9FLAO|nr:AraC family transcriptional regulator [Polaribacter batillariae]QTD38085.1 helix-turn-helix transcriptional regulator [Polaribacter batillariae]
MDYPQLLFITSPLFFFILPLVYVFQNRLNVKSKYWFMHFVFPILMLILFIPTILMNDNDKLSMYHADGINDPIWLVLLYLLFSIYYSIKTFIANKEHKALLLNTSANNDIELQLFSNKLIFLASVCIIIIPISLLIQYLDFNTKVVDKFLFIIFSLIPHFIVISISNIKTFENSNEIRIEERQTSVVEHENLDTIKSELTGFMMKCKPYLRQDLNLQTLANLVSWNRSKLSMVINKGFGKNFYDYVNEYRLEAVVEKLNSGKHKDYSLDYIVSECGFKSYVSFYRIFKRVKKKSPKDYLRHLKSQ